MKGVRKLETIYRIPLTSTPVNRNIQSHRKEFGISFFQQCVLILVLPGVS
jgi:hypothetical protein